MTPRTKRSSLGALCTQYRGPILRYMLRRSSRDDEAEEWANEFILQLLQSKAFERADQGRGHFRNYLRAAMHKFALKQIRKKYGQSELASLDDNGVPKIADPNRFADAEQDFHRAWVATLLGQALEEVRRHYQFSAKQTKEQYWDIFCDRVLDPTLDGVEAPTLPEIAEKYGISQNRVSSISNIIVNVKRRFRLVIGRAVREYTDEVPEEIAELIKTLDSPSRPPAGPRQP